MSFKIEHPLRGLVLVLAGCALLLWGFYLATLSPAFPPDDSPETVAAAFTLGIQHPPGYPLAALLGRCAVVALPLGSPAFRVNLLSAALACLAALLSGTLAWRLSGDGSPGTRLAGAALATLGLGFLAVYWDQATEAKGGLYLLNLALGFGLWHSALGARLHRRVWMAWGGLAGLMLADHYPSAVLWIVPTAFWMAWRSRREGASGAWRSGALAALPGASLYLILPLRAAYAPLLNWGDPGNWRQLWWVVTRGGYTQAAVQGPVAQAQAALWWSSLWQRGLVWLAPLAVWGAYRLWPRRDVALAFAGAICLALVAALAVNKTPADNRWLALIFALPATALLAPLAGVGAVAWMDRLPPRTAALALPISLALGLWAASAQFARADRSASYTAWDYARDLSLSLPRGALYLGEGDYHVLPLLHLQAVEGRRSDVDSVLNALAGEAWYQRVLARRDPALRLASTGSAEQASLEMTRRNSPARPVRISPYSAWITPQALGAPLHQVGLARALGPPVAAPDPTQAWAARWPARYGGDLEPVEAALLPWYTVALVQHGNEAMSLGQPLTAVPFYRRALERPGAKPEAMLAANLGLAYEEARLKAPAIAAFQRALRADPGFAPAAQHLQVLHAQP